MACVSIKFPELNCPPQYSYVLIYKTCNPPDGNNEPLSQPNEIGNSDPYQVLVQTEFDLDPDYYRTSRIKVARVKGNYTIALDSYQNFGINADCPPNGACPSVEFGGPFYYINGLSSSGQAVYYSCPFVWINLEENILPNGNTIPAETILNKLPQNQIQFYIEWGFFKPINYYYPQIMFSTNGLPPTWSQNEINQTETPINFCNIGPEIGTTFYPGASENLPFATFCENNLLPNPFFADLSQIDPEPLADGWQVITGDGGQGWFLEEQIYNYTRWYNFRGESTARLQTDWTPILDQQYVVSFTVDVRTSPTNAPSKIIVNLGNSFEIFEFITPGPKFVSTSIYIPLVSTVPLNNSLYFTAVCPFFDENDTIAITNICVVEYNLGCLCYKIGLVNTSTWGTGYFVKVNWTDCNNNSHQVWLTPAQPVVNACVRNNQLEINQGLQDVLNQNYSLENQQINCDTDYCEEQSCYCYSFKIGTNETITYINCDDEPVYVTRINLETYNYNGTNVIWPTSSLPRICAKVIVDSYYIDPTTGYESRIPSLNPYSSIGETCPVDCEVAPPAPSPTQTPTVTRTNTPTPSVTKTNTPTRTQTPTITPTRTKTPSVTPTRTKTQTPTKTPTRTVTQTPTKTKTPTPTKTPIICYCYTMTNNTAQAQGYGYINCSTGGGVIGNVQTGSSVTVCARQTTLNTSLAIVTGTTCSTVCPPLTPSPTPTNTVTPTKTPTVTPTKTKTPTVTPTQSPIVENRCNLLQIWVPCGGSNNAPTSGPVHVFLYNGPNQFTEINLGVAINWENQASVYPYRWTADITHTIDFSNNTGKMWISVTDTSGNYVIHEWDINITLAGSYNFSVNYVRQINLPSGLKLGKGLTAKDNTTLISSTQTLSNPYSSSPSSIIEIDISNTSVPLDLTNSDITTLFNLPVAGDVFNTSSGNITIDPQSRVDVWGDLVLTEDDKLIIVGKQVVYNQEYSASYLKVLLQYNYLDNQLEFIKEYAASASTGNEMYPAILNGNVVVTIFVQGNCSPGFYFNTVNSVTGEIGQVSAQVGPSGSIVGPFGTSSPKYLAGTNPCINASLTPNIS